MAASSAKLTTYGRKRDFARTPEPSGLLAAASHGNQRCGRDPVRCLCRSCYRHVKCAHSEVMARARRGYMQVSGRSTSTALPAATSTFR
jgi:hypothetical protein